MSSRITKVVSNLSSVYTVKSTLRTLFYSPEHFPKILGGSMLCAFVGSYCMMESSHQSRLKAQEEQYAQAWDAYSREKQRHNEQYETDFKPSSIQKRRLTKSNSVVFLSPDADANAADASIERVRLSQE